MKYLKLTGYLLFLFMVIVLILEAGLRASGTYKTYSEMIGHGYSTYYGESRPDWYWTYPLADTFVLDHGEFAYTYITNSLGMREKEIPPADSSGIRLFVFGDSFTDGVGAAYDSTWPRQLERDLLKDGYHANVYNTGISGSDPFYSFQLLKDRILPLQPSHVIFTTNSNDLEDVVFRSGFDRFMEDGTARNRPAPGFHSWYRRSHFCRWYVENVMGYNKALVKRREMDAKLKEAAAAIKTCMDSTYAICREHNIKFMMVTHIPPHILCAPRPDSLDVRVFTDLEYDYPHVFLEDQFRSDIEVALCYNYCWKTDGHFNGKGYTIMGDILFNEIRENYPEFW